MNKEQIKAIEEIMKMHYHAYCNTFQSNTLNVNAGSFFKLIINSVNDIKYIKIGSIITPSIEIDLPKNKKEKIIRILNGDYPLISKEESKKIEIKKIKKQIRILNIKLKLLEEGEE